MAAGLEIPTGFSSQFPDKTGHILGELSNTLQALHLLLVHIESSVDFYLESMKALRRCAVMLSVEAAGIWIVAGNGIAHGLQNALCRLDQPR